MTTNWADVLQKLRSYSPGVHTIRPPCPQSRIATTERQLGKLPSELLGMVAHFDGARLFESRNGCALVTLFGISEDHPLDPFEWGEDWWIDKFTPLWRGAGGPSRQNDWAIAMMNYGELILLNGQGTIRKWDTSQQQWEPGSLPFDQWLQDLLREGDIYLHEE
jgi:hypothetical protein